jgi:hypothetical protein
MARMRDRYNPGQDAGRPPDPDGQE